MTHFRTWSGMFRGLLNSTHGCYEARARFSSAEVFRSLARSKRRIAIDAEDTMAQGLPASAKPNGMGVARRVAAILEGGFAERKMVSMMGNSRSDASYP